MLSFVIVLLMLLFRCLKLMFSYPALLNKIKDSKKDLKGSVEICIQVREGKKMRTETTHT